MNANNKSTDSSSSGNSPPTSNNETQLPSTIVGKVIDTSDPDIQIIESTSTSKTSLMEARFARKRALNPHIQYKDHSKNPLFKSTLQDHMRSLAASGLALNQHQAIALRLRRFQINRKRAIYNTQLYLAQHVIRGLNEYGWAVCDHFLGDTHCNYTYKEVERLFDRGLFSAGQLMDRKDNSQLQDIRSDQIYWFDGSDERARDSVTVRLLISMIDSVIVHFRDRVPYTISGRSRAMIACYPGNGTKYVKHVDNPVQDGRCITSIYYCNKDWKLSEHGGTLRLYPETSLVPMDIDPQADRLVFFWSDRRNPHEVLPVFRPRYAITIWYFDQAEKMEALERRRKQENPSTPSASTVPAEIPTSSSPTKSRAPALSDWSQQRASAFKPVATTNFISPNISATTENSNHLSLVPQHIIASSSSSTSSPFIIPRSHMSLRDHTNSDSFSTGSADDNLNIDDEPINTQPKQDYQI
uniref:hypoxia-inducible factor-proline dioxygenase n=1 Tax=Panagrolaimus davidi TaxID=227884 RepID=A0A914PRV3_9BILA